MYFYQGRTNKLTNTKNTHKTNSKKFEKNMTLNMLYEYHDRKKTMNNINNPMFDYYEIEDFVELDDRLYENLEKFQNDVELLYYLPLELKEKLLEFFYLYKENKEKFNIIIVNNEYPEGYHEYHEEYDIKFDNLFNLLIEHVKIPFDREKKYSDK